MVIFGLIVALCLFMHFKHRVRYYRRVHGLEDERIGFPGGASWHEEWERHWAQKFRRQAERRMGCERGHRHSSRRERKRAEAAAESARAQQEAQTDAQARFEAEARFRAGARADGTQVNGAHVNGTRVAGDAAEGAAATNGKAQATASGDARRDAQILKRARRRAAAEVGFYAHLMSYLGVIGFLALINLLTARYPWFLWPALGWGVGMFAHYMAVFGARMLKDRYFYPAVEREVRREVMGVRTEKQASIDELSATIAHEIRNPVAAAKSLVQQMGEDPRSFENVEYANVALDELDRVERSISHLLALREGGGSRVRADEPRRRHRLGAHRDARQARCGARRGGAELHRRSDRRRRSREATRQVFANIIDNAIDAFGTERADRRLDLFIENGIPKRVRVRVRDNGVGIPPEKIDRIFNPFFSTKETGTGLGMAISKKIVEAHDGSIDVASKPGEGTEFVVTLPLPS